MIYVVGGFGLLWILASLVLLCIVLHQLLFHSPIKINGQLVSNQDGWLFAGVFASMSIIFSIAIGMGLKLLLNLKKSNETNRFAKNHD